MAEFSFDVTAIDAIKRSEIDKQGAADALLIAAGYLRRREPLPGNLADWLADAIDASMGKPKPGPALLLELGLTALNRRPKADWIDVGMRWDTLVNCEGMTKTKAKEQVALEFDVDLTTVKRYVKHYEQADAEYRRSIED